MSEAEQNNEEEFPTIEEEFRNLYVEAESMQARFMKIAAAKENPEIAELLRLLAGDVIPLIMDNISATGISLAEIETQQQQEATLSEDEASQIYATLQANKLFFGQIIEAPNLPTEMVEGVKRLLGLNEESMKILVDTYGEELAETADEMIEQAHEEQH